MKKVEKSFSNQAYDSQSLDPSQAVASETVASRKRWSEKEKQMRANVLMVGDNPGGNYVAKIQELSEQHPEILTGVHHVSVKHNSWCGIFEGRPCDCDVEVKLEAV